MNHLVKMKTLISRSSQALRGCQSCPLSEHIFSSKIAVAQHRVVTSITCNNFSFVVFISIYLTERALEVAEVANTFLKSEVKVLATLCNPMDFNSPGSSVHGIL